MKTTPQIRLSSLKQKDLKVEFIYFHEQLTSAYIGGTDFGEAPSALIIAARSPSASAVSS